MTVAILIMQTFAFLALHILPASLLIHWLAHLLSRGRYHFVPAFSGRVALFTLASQLRKVSNSSVALLPDYLCNVVERAFAMAGWEIVKYRTNELLEPDWHELLDAIEHQKVGVLVGASVFGSSGLLNFLSDLLMQEELRKRGVIVVVDLAQDICLIDKLPLDCADFVHAVVSFNDKSFPGAMGGGILSEWEQIRSLSLDSPPRAEAERLYFWFAAKLLDSLRRMLLVWLKGLGKFSSNIERAPISRYDYSFCRDYPFRIEYRKPIKLQLIMAIIGIYSLPYLRQKKKKFLSLNLHTPTQFAESAAYLIIDKTKTFEALVQGTTRSRKLKPPYAIEGNPNSSLRPHDIIVHNKGFDDEG